MKQNTKLQREETAMKSEHCNARLLYAFYTFSLFVCRIILRIKI
jgi:hypothetical protein